MVRPAMVSVAYRYVATLSTRDDGLRCHPHSPGQFGIRHCSEQGQFRFCPAMMAFAKDRDAAVTAGAVHERARESHFPGQFSIRHRSEQGQFRFCPAMKMAVFEGNAETPAK